VGTFIWPARFERADHDARVRRFLASKLMESERWLPLEKNDEAAGEKVRI
jgi:hypothetical protein